MGVCIRSIRRPISPWSNSRRGAYFCPTFSTALPMRVTLFAVAAGLPGLYSAQVWNQTETLLDELEVAADRSGCVRSPRGARARVRRFGSVRSACFLGAGGLQMTSYSSGVETSLGDSSISSSPARTVSAAESRKVIFASTIGTAFEFYEFFLYGAMAPTLESTSFRVSIRRRPIYLHYLPLPRVFWCAPWGRWRLGGSAI